MAEDQFLQELIESRIASRMARYRAFVIHLIISLTAVFGVIFASAAEQIGMEVAIIVTMVAMLSMLGHALVLGLQEARTFITRQEVNRIEAEYPMAILPQTEKSKRDDRLSQQEPDWQFFDDEPDGVAQLQE